MDDEQQLDDGTGALLLGRDAEAFALSPDTRANIEAGWRSGRHERRALRHKRAPGACRLPAAHCKHAPGRSRRAGGSARARVVARRRPRRDRSACDAAAPIGSRATYLTAGVGQRRQPDPSRRRGRTRVKGTRRPADPDDRRSFIPFNFGRRAASHQGSLTERRRARWRRLSHQGDCDRAGDRICREGVVGRHGCARSLGRHWHGQLGAHRDDRSPGMRSSRG